MTFVELIEAVHRDVAAIDPTGCVKVECGAWYFGHKDGDKCEIGFEIWYDRFSEHYKGRTPDEAYAKFAAAVLPPATITTAEALALCDTPEAVQS